VAAVRGLCLAQVGPACEREFGAYNLVKIMTWTAVVSGVAHMVLGPANAYQLGASGVVFMLM
jgi:membrane associated rhomboid family serine protease